jgi:uncharacterized YigZ family protein
MGELREKGSRFLALVLPCADRARAEERLAGFRQQYADATHVCWAWRLLSEGDPGEASSDAGEPSGTAGVPILGALQKAGLWNVLGVVVRWYGGTNLGRGGLIRAYREATTRAVEDADIEQAVPLTTACVSVPLERVGDAHRVLSTYHLRYGDQDVQEGRVVITVELAAADLARLEADLAEATQGEGSLLFPGEATT